MCILLFIVCIAATYGTYYADITGEYHWVAKMIDKYQSTAERSGSKLISLSGFDSLPADLGTLYAVNELKNKVGDDIDITSCIGYVSVVIEPGTPMGLGASGGTLSSMLTLIEQRSEYGNKLLDPYLLVPQPQKAQLQSQNYNDRDQMLPTYSYDINSWTAPFVMAAANTRVVRRSAALYQAAGYNYGNKFHYNENLAVSNFIYATGVTIGMGITVASLLIPPIRSLIKKYITQPGAGPSAQQRAGTTIIYTHVAQASNGDKLYTTFSTVDPGYANTATFLAHTGLLLLDQKLSANQQTNGITINKHKPCGINQCGFLTSSTALGYQLIDRLNSLNTGVLIQVSKYVKATH